MASKVSFEFTKFDSIDEQGNVTATTYGYRIYDDFDAQYNNTYASLDNLTNEISLETLLKFISENHSEFLDSIYYYGLYFNGKRIDIKGLKGEEDLNYPESSIDIITNNKNCTDNQLEIHKILTLSTTHISKKTADSLNMLNNEDLILYKKDEFGWFIYIIDGDSERINDKSIPDDLAAIIKLAKSKECEIICLDRDACKVDGLFTYDWDSFDSSVAQSVGEGNSDIAEYVNETLHYLDYREQLKNINWEYCNTGGNVIVLFKDMPLNDGITRCVGVNDECVVIYNTLLNDENFGENEDSQLAWWPLSDFIVNGKVVDDFLWDESYVNILDNPFKYYREQFLTIGDYFNEGQLEELIHVYKLYNNIKNSCHKLR